MTETPEQWLEQLFEYEFCAECGGDAADHDVFIVPGMGTYFARCRRPGRWPDADPDEIGTPGPPHETG